MQFLHMLKPQWRSHCRTWQVSEACIGSKQIGQSCSIDAREARLVLEWFDWTELILLRVPGRIESGAGATDVFMFLYNVVCV